MRHTFRFPIAVKEAVRSYVRDAIARMRPDAYSQEQNYTVALAGKLDGVVYEGEHGYVEFRSTVANDKAKGSAESWSGIDFVITAFISDERQQVDKAIIFQSKKGAVENLSAKEFARLQGQIERMQGLTRSPKILEVPDGSSKYHPTVVSANRVHSAQSFRHVDLEDYFVQRVLTTFDGDTRPYFVSGVEESSFTMLKLLAKISGRL